MGRWPTEGGVDASMVKKAEGRTEELAKSLSMLRATLEATTDGILAVDGRGKVTGCNSRFVEMWHLPREFMGSEMESEMLERALPQLRYPTQFIAKVEELYADPEAESFDTLEFLDGRVFERFSKPQRIEGSVVGRVWSFRDVSERKRAEGELRFKTAFLEAQVNCSFDGILVVDSLGKKLVQNQRLNELWNIPPHVAQDDDDQKQIQFVMNQVRNKEEFVAKIVYLYAHPGETSRDEVTLTDGTVMDRYSYPVVAGDGTYYGRIWSFRDITDRRRFEEQLRQAQKMEAVGQLSGGIAHDFNNLLNVIIGFNEMLLRDLPADEDRLRRYANRVATAANRGAGLTRQLLAFSRQQVLQPKVVDLNAVITEAEKLLGRLLGEDLAVVTGLTHDLGAVEVDPGQIEQVIMNLAVNARDAMPQGGVLTIETSNFELLDSATQQYPYAVTPGPYVRLTVADTGTGMDGPTQAHIFEPFFTTKEAGKGTGLGLATVYGIVKQSKGYIWVESEMGQGTRFTILLPRLPQDTSVGEDEPPQGSEPRGTETLFVVEDDEAARALWQETLQALGYHLMVASNGSEALAMAAVHPGRIDLLLTDVVMPHTGGRELAERLTAARPDLRVIFMSGYTADTMLRQGIAETGLPFLQKPFSAHQLARKVRDTLDDTPPARLLGVGRAAS
jgi:two-component system cell cycle sensor histidine kinase/response regulator CckA